MGSKRWGHRAAVPHPQWRCRLPACFDGDVCKCKGLCGDGYQGSGGAGLWAAAAPGNPDHAPGRVVQQSNRSPSRGGWSRAGMLAGAEVVPSLQREELRLCLSPSPRAAPGIQGFRHGTASTSRACLGVRQKRCFHQRSEGVLEGAPWNVLEKL